MAEAVLTLNAGSSSIKFGLFERDGRVLKPVLGGLVDGIGRATHFLAHDGAGTTLADRRWSEGTPQGHEDVLGEVLDWLEAHLGPDKLVAVGHRVVHGGPRYDQPVLVTEAVVAELERLTPLAPLHQPHSLAPIRAIAAVRPGLPQVACFDTAFHHSMAPVVTRLALPRCYEAEGVRRYGFHGLSYEYIAGRLRETSPALASGRVIVAHLGNGASLCAMADGRSVDTTMGFTALDGLVMGTRCGTIDPGVVLYLQREHAMSVEAVQTLLYEKSGLLGVSGLSGDMRALLESPEPAAREAIELFVFRIGRETGGLVSTLDGLDGFVFTAGIGEHTAAIRADVCRRLAWLGVKLDPEANARGIGRISTASSRVEVQVIPTNEEAMIARHTSDVVGG